MIFMYHGVVPDSAADARWCIGQALPASSVRRQILWLARHFRVVSVSDYLAVAQEAEERKLAAITFDDGGRVTFEVVAPLLRLAGVPATFFVSTGHLCGGPLLWFSFLNALCFDGGYADVEIQGRPFRLRSLREQKHARREAGVMARASGDPAEFVAALAQVYPLSTDAVYEYGGMTAGQLEAAGKDDLLEIGSHTVTHPYLTDRSPAEQTAELVESKQVLSSLTRRQVRYFAYPSGDYDDAVLTRVREAGYEAAFATRPRNVGVLKYEIPRVGIYSPSILKLWLKAAGAVEMLELLRIRAG